MPILTELYVASRTRNVEDADTEDLPVLVVKRGTQIVFTKPLFGGGFRTARGAGAIWRFDVSSANLDSADLQVWLFASNADAWAPEHIIAWGISGRVGDERVIPLGAFIEAANPTTPAAGGTWVSTDQSEGERELFVFPIGRGRDGTRANRLIVITATDPYGGLFPAAVGPGGAFEDTGTAGPMTLQAGGAGRLVLSYTLPTSPQGDLGHGHAAFHVVDLAAPFSRADLAGGFFTLTIGSDDWWKPDYIAVFGMDDECGQPGALIPFVAASAFELRQMSSNSAEGWHSIRLPLAKVLPQRPPHPDVDLEDLDGVFSRSTAHDEGHEPTPGDLSEAAGRAAQ